MGSEDSVRWRFPRFKQLGSRRFNNNNEPTILLCVALFGFCNKYGLMCPLLNLMFFFVGRTTFCSHYKCKIPTEVHGAFAETRWAHGRRSPSGPLYSRFLAGMFKNRWFHEMWKANREQTDEAWLDFQLSNVSRVFVAFYTCYCRLSINLFLRPRRTSYPLLS